MLKKSFIFIFFIILILFSLSCNKKIKDEGIFAVFNTNKGSFTCQIYYTKVPVTSANFISLAEGTREFTDPFTDEKVKKPFYNGLIFHRIVKDFIIQGGCPRGDGSGSPGKNSEFSDEFREDLKHDREGILSMANSGPNTNGSQFFITLSSQPHLNRRHSVFGKIISGMETVKKIAELKTDGKDKPYQEVYIKNLKIIRNGSDAKNFNTEEVFAKKKEIFQKNIQDKTFIKELGVDLNKLIDYKGIEYFVRNEGAGIKPSAGDTIVAHYTLYLQNGRLLDSSFLRNSPFQVEIGIDKVIKGWDIAFLNMKEGEKRVLIIPYDLAYGETGLPPEIPAKSALVFDVELIKVIKK